MWPYFEILGISLRTYMQVWIVYFVWKSVSINNLFMMWQRRVQVMVSTTLKVSIRYFRHIVWYKCALAQFTTLHQHSRMKLKISFTKKWKQLVVSLMVWESKHWRICLSKRKVRKMTKTQDLEEVKKTICHIGRSIIFHVRVVSACWCGYKWLSNLSWVIKAKFALLPKW